MAALSSKFVPSPVFDCIFESNQLLQVISGFLSVRDIGATSCVSKGVFETYRSIPGFWLRVGIGAPYFADVATIRQSPTEKLAVQMLDDVYQNILVSDNVVWLVSRLNFYSRCRGIIEQCFNRLADLIEDGGYYPITTGLNHKIDPEKVLDLYRTNCLSEIVRILKDSISSSSTVRCGLRLAIVLTRPLPVWDGIEANELRALRRKCINSSDLTVCTMAIASAYANDSCILLLVLQAFQNLSFFSKQLSALLDNDILHSLPNLLHVDQSHYADRDIKKVGLQLYLNLLDPLEVPQDVMQLVISTCISCYETHPGEEEIAVLSLLLLKHIAVWNRNQLQSDNKIIGFVNRICADFNCSRSKIGTPHHVASLVQFFEWKIFAQASTSTDPGSSTDD